MNEQMENTVANKENCIENNMLAKEDLLSISSCQQFSPAKKAEFGRQHSRFAVSSVHSNEGYHVSFNGGGSHMGSQLSMTNSAAFGSTHTLKNDPVLPLTGDAGSSLGSALLLASPSYLSIYHASLENVDEVGQEVDEKDIFDNPEYIDTLEGRLPLAEAACMIAKDSTYQKRLFSEEHIRRTRNDSYRKVLTIGISFICIFSAYFPVRVLQSSTGDDPTLGIITFGSLTSLMWLGGISASPLIHRIRPKWSMCIASIPFLLYPCANFYPRVYTLLPAALLTGFGYGLLWSSEGIYLMNVASTYALVSGEPLISILGKFNSIIFSFFLGSNILGNLLSSLLLGDLYTFPGEITTENAQNITIGIIASNVSSSLNTSQLDTVCGLNFYSTPQQSVSRAIDQRKIYLFLGATAFLAMLGTINILTQLKKLKVARKPGGGSFPRSLKRFICMFSKPRSLLILPFLLYFGTVISVILSDYNAAFIACQYGVGKIGFVTLTGYSFSVAGAIVSGRLVGKIGRVPLFITGSLCSTASMLTILLWKPEVGDLPVIAFLPVCLWCISDGILFSLVTGFLGILFQKELIFALSMQSASAGLGILCSTLPIAYGLITMTMKIYVILAVLGLAMTCYLVLEYLLNKGKI